MIAFLLKRNNWTKIVLQQADFYCGERKKNGRKSYRYKAFQRENVFEPIIGRLCKSPEISGD